MEDKGRGDEKFVGKSASLALRHTRRRWAFRAERSKRRDPNPTTRRTSHLTRFFSRAKTHVCFFLLRDETGKSECVVARPNKSLSVSFSPPALLPLLSTFVRGSLARYFPVSRRGGLLSRPPALRYFVKTKGLKYTIHRYVQPREPRTHTTCVHRRTRVWRARMLRARSRALDSGRRRYMHYREKEGGGEREENRQPCPSGAVSLRFALISRAHHRRVSIFHQFSISTPKLLEASLSRCLLREESVSSFLIASSYRKIAHTRRSEPLFVPPRVQLR